MEISSRNANQHVRHVHNLRAHMISYDITLIVGNKEFLVHRVVMAAHSKRLEELFVSSEDKKQEEKSLVLKHVTEAGLEAIIKFVYDGHLEINQNNAEDIYSAATYLQMDPVVELSLKFLNESWTEDNNYKPILDIATRLNLKELRRKILLRYMEDFAVNHGKDFLSLKFDEFLDLLKSDSLRVRPEYKAFQLLWKWINQDFTNRMVFLENLMNQIRLPLLTSSQLDEVGKLKEIASSGVCQSLLIEARKYKTNVHKQPLLQTTRTIVRWDKPRIILSTDTGLMCLSKNAPHRLCNPPVTLQSAYVIVVDNFMYVYGGILKNSVQSNAPSTGFYRYDPRLDVWTTLQQSLLPIKENCACVAYKNCIYVIGGTVRDRPGGRVTSQKWVDQFSIEFNEWKRGVNLTKAISHHSAAVLENRIYISGGVNEEALAIPTVWSWEAESNFWSREKPLVQSRCNHTMVAVGERMFVIGGEVSNTQDDSTGYQGSIEMFTPATRAWTLCKATIECSMSGVIACNRHVYIIPGKTSPDVADYNCIHVYSPDDDSFVSNRNIPVFDNIAGYPGKICRHVCGSAYELIFPQQH